MNTASRIIFFSSVLILLALIFSARANASQFAYIEGTSATSEKLIFISADSSGKYTSRDSGLTFSKEAPQEGEAQISGTNYELLSAYKHKGQQRLLIRGSEKIYIYDPSNLPELLMSADIDTSSKGHIADAAEHEYNNHPIFRGSLGGSYNQEKGSYEESWSVIEFNPETGAVVNSRVGSENIMDLQSIAVANNKIFVNI